MEHEGKKAQRSIEIEQERQDAERIAAKHLESKLAKKAQKQEQLEHFKAVWEAQKSLKNRCDVVDNQF